VLLCNPVEVSETSIPIIKPCRVFQLDLSFLQSTPKRLLHSRFHRLTRTHNQLTPFLPILAALRQPLHHRGVLSNTLRTMIRRIAQNDPVRPIHIPRQLPLRCLIVIMLHKLRKNIKSRVILQQGDPRRPLRRIDTNQEVLQLDEDAWSRDDGDRSGWGAVGEELGGKEVGGGVAEPELGGVPVFFEVGD
jgi:hypothetical protein